MKLTLNRKDKEMKGNCPDNETWALILKYSTPEMLKLEEEGRRIEASKLDNAIRRLKKEDRIMKQV